MRVATPVALAAAMLIGAAAAAPPLARTPVDIVRVPNGGIQPEIAVDARGAIHMVFLAGEPGSADVFYVKSRDGGKTFSAAVRVNRQNGSAIATGTIRGAQLAIGRNGRIHVAWNGSSSAEPKPPINPKTRQAGMPMLYARSNVDGTSFEPQRNLITQTTNLDGGGSLAADDDGRVLVAWHGQAADGEGGEAARRVWIARSGDDGATFSPEAAVSDPSTGVCGCCALRLAATPTGHLHLLYRAATDVIHRDIHALVSRDHGDTFTGRRVHGWDIATCPMSSMSIVPGSPVRYAWETDGQVYFASAETATAPNEPPVGTTAESRRRKHPRLAVSADGKRLLLAWTEGTAWARGGSLAWQIFDADGRPADLRGTQGGVPVWSFVAVAARPDGSFVIVY